MPLDTDDDTTLRLLVVLVLAIIHSLYMAFGVSKQSVIDASRIYARQLTCRVRRSLVRSSPQKSLRKRRRKVASRWVAEDQVFDVRGARCGAAQALNCCIARGGGSSALLCALRSLLPIAAPLRPPAVAALLLV